MRIISPLDAGRFSRCTRRLGRFKPRSGPAGPTSEGGYHIRREDFWRKRGGPCRPKIRGPRPTGKLIEAVFQEGPAAGGPNAVEPGARFAAAQGRPPDSGSPARQQHPIPPSSKPSLGQVASSADRLRAKTPQSEDLAAGAAQSDPAWTGIDPSPSRNTIASRPTRRALMTASRKQIYVLEV